MKLVFQEKQHIRAECGIRKKVNLVIDFQIGCVLQM